MSDDKCGRCGLDPAAGLATINDVRFCHEGESPTCYELATRAETRRMLGEVEEKSGVPFDLPPEDVMREILGQHADNPTVRRWVGEFRQFSRERQGYGFWDRLGLDEGGMPMHLPMPLTASGDGPADEEDATHLGCWCPDPECRLRKAFDEAHKIAQRGMVDVEQVRAALRLIGNDHITAAGKRQIEKVLDQ